MMTKAEKEYSKAWREATRRMKEEEYPSALPVKQDMLEACIEGQKLNGTYHTALGAMVRTMVIKIARRSKSRRVRRVHKP